MAETKTLPPKPPYINPKEASIEAQVAVYAIAEVQAAGKEIPEDLILAKDAWCRYALRNYIGIKV